jgi:hypothetical protein
MIGIKVFAKMVHVSKSFSSTNASIVITSKEMEQLTFE